MSISRLRITVVAIAGLALAGLLACDTQEDLDIAADGSGRYSARISVEEPYKDRLAEIESKALAAGFEIDSRGSADRHFLVVSKRFRDVSELNLEGATFSLRSRDVSSTKRTYTLRIDFPRTPKPDYRRIVHVSMPGKIISGGSGKAEGSKLEWDASYGGSTTIVASGFVVPLTREQKWMIGGGALALLALVFLVRWLRRPKVRKCDSCGNEIPEDALFCHLCEQGSGEVPRRGAA